LLTILDHQLIFFNNSFFVSFSATAPTGPGPPHSRGS